MFETVWRWPRPPRPCPAERDQARACCHSRIIRRSVWFGKSPVFSSASPVIGLVDLVASQRSIADRSYEWPSAAITGSLMSSVVMGDPVMATDGHSYERKQIERWLATKSTSPMTGEALEHSILTPNHALRGRIREWQEAHH